MDLQDQTLLPEIRIFSRYYSFASVALNEGGFIISECDEALVEHKQSDEFDR